MLKTIISAARERVNKGVCVKGVRTCVWACASRVCDYILLVQFAAEMSHLLAASIEMAHIIGCTLCT